MLATTSSVLDAVAGGLGVAASATIAMISTSPQSAVVARVMPEGDKAVILASHCSETRPCDPARDSGTLPHVSAWPITGRHLSTSQPPLKRLRAIAFRLWTHSSPFLTILPHSSAASALALFHSHTLGKGKGRAREREKCVTGPRFSHFSISRFPVFPLFHFHFRFPQMLELKGQKGLRRPRPEAAVSMRQAESCPTGLLEIDN